jgi:hypothetical protein
LWMWFIVIWACGCGLLSSGLVDVRFIAIWARGYAFYCHLGLWVCFLLLSGFAGMLFTVICACRYVFFCHMVCGYELYCHLGF